MFITPINSFSQNKLSYNNLQPKNKNISFKENPLYTQLSKKYSIDASSYFRRGPYYGVPSDEFTDIINLFKKIFKNTQNKKNMLIGGIGKSQEPFSYLATIKYWIKDKKIKDVLDLHVVDLQPKPNNSELFINSYYDVSGIPEYVPSSFVKDKLIHNNKILRYRVNNEIFNFLSNTYNDKTRSKWDTTLQDSIKKCPNETFDIISLNNILYYIEDIEDRNNALRHIERVLKPNGVLITDFFKTYVKDAGLSNSIKETELLGIYIKK